MSGEHASRQIIDGYARGDADIAADEVWALEAHMEGCRVCRDGLSAAVTAQASAVEALVATVWSDLAPQLAGTAPMPHRRCWSARLSSWLTPYARSRQVPASLLAVVISAVAVWALTRDESAEPGDPRPAVLVLAAGVMAASTGLSGQDRALDRTAAIRWAPRRALHVLLAGAVVAAVLLALQTTGKDLATTAFVVRDSAGLMGLAAVGAAVCGGQHAWTLPFAWLSYSFFAPPATGVPTQVATWMLLPPGTTAGTWTALTLAVVGTAAYAVAGPRRWPLRATGAGPVRPGPRRCGRPRWVGRPDVDLPGTVTCPAPGAVTAPATCRARRVRRPARPG